MKFIQKKKIWIKDIEKKKKTEGALGVEPRTYRSAVDCSTTELYPRWYNRESKFDYLNLDL